MFDCPVALWKLLLLLWGSLLGSGLVGGLLGLLVSGSLGLFCLDLAGLSLLLGDDGLDGLLLLEEECSLDSVSSAVHASGTTISSGNGSVGLCESLVLVSSKAWDTNDLTLAVTASWTLGGLLDDVEGETTTWCLHDLSLV